MQDKQNQGSGLEYGRFTIQVNLPGEGTDQIPEIHADSIFGTQPEPVQETPAEIPEPVPEPPESTQAENPQPAETPREPEEPSNPPQTEPAAPDPRPERPRRVQPAKKYRRQIPLNLIAILLTAVLLAVSVVAYRVDMARLNPAPEEDSDPAILQEGDTITIAAAGDINANLELLQGARQAGYTYDFTDMLMGAVPLLSDADVTVANLEANLIDGIYDGQNGNVPPSLLNALAGAGVDILQTANTLSVFNGLSGLTTTAQAVQDAGMIPVGTFPTQESFRRTGGFTMLEVKGFRIAFVAFTKGVGNLQLPEGSGNCVNLLYKDYATTYQNVDRAGIQAVLNNVAAAQPDITVALLHWGSEYDGEISDTQEEIRELMLSGGVDVILGTHSHRVGEVQVENGTVTAYSLGNLLSTNADGLNQGIVLKLTFRVEGGVPVLKETTYEPIYLASTEETRTGAPRLMATNSVISLYESSYITRVSDDIYETLCRSRDKVADLVHPVHEVEE